MNTAPYISPKDLCPKCQIDHSVREKSQGVGLLVEISELCTDCKKRLGFKIKAGRNEMAKKKRGRRKYTKSGTTAVKRPKLDKDTKKFIKGILGAGKKAVKLETKANKLQARVDSLRETAAQMRAGVEALKSAIKEAC